MGKGIQKTNASLKNAHVAVHIEIMKSTSMLSLHIIPNQT